MFLANEYPALKDIIKVKISQDVYLSIDVCLQTIKSNGKIYLKVLLVNSSTQIKSSDVRYFSIVTEKINERSVFGASIKISSPHLLEYHRMNSYDSCDEEANTLRFLYKIYHTACYTQIINGITVHIYNLSNKHATKM